MKAVAILTAVFLYLLAFLVIATFTKDREEHNELIWLFFVSLPLLAFYLWEAFGP